MPLNCWLKYPSFKSEWVPLMATQKTVKLNKKQNANKLAFLATDKL